MADQIIYTYRYLDDMGPLSKRTFQNKGFREEPTLATRIDEYNTYLQKEGELLLVRRLLLEYVVGDLP